VDGFEDEEEELEEMAGLEGDDGDVDLDALLEEEMPQDKLLDGPLSRFDQSSKRFMRRALRIAAQRCGWCIFAPSLSLI
jgi:hypothetical protein